MSVKVKDNGADALPRKAKRLSETAVVRVGIFGSKAVEAKMSEDSDSSDLTVVQVAQQHEFGIGVPRRSFLRDYHDQNQAAIKKRLLKSAEKMWKSKSSDPAKRELGLLGEYLKDGIITRIENGIPPANSQATIDRKGSETPLIDTGQLKSSIDYEVERGRS